MDSAFLKQAELRFRGWLLRRRWSGSAPLIVPSPTPLVRPAPGSRVLFLRQDRIGDVLVSVPTLRVFCSHFPEATVELLLSRNNWEVRRAVQPYVQQCWRYEKRPYAILRLLHQLRRRTYDIVIDLTDNPSVTSSLLLEYIKAPIRIGISKGNDAAYTHVVPSADRARTHIVERIARLLFPFGVDPSTEDLQLEYPITEEDRAWAESVLGPCRGAYRMGICISASHPSKYWGRDNWSYFLLEIRRRYPEAELLLFASPAYASEQQALSQATGVHPAPLVPSFHSFAALLERCHVLVTPDTATVHLAAAWQRPSVVLYVWDRSELMPWFPYRSPYEAVYTTQGSLYTLPVEDALAAVERLLRRIPLPSLVHG